MRLLDRIRAQPASTKPPKRHLGLAGLRYSKEDQGSGNTIEAQRVRVQAFAQRQGISLVPAEEGGEFVHEATSAFADKRRIWDKMVEAAIKDERVGYLLFDSGDRFYRDQYLAGGVKGKLRAHGIRAVYCDIGMPDDPYSVPARWMEGITDIQSETGSIITRYHTIKGQKQNVHTRDQETGWCYKNGCMPPYGFKIVRLQRGWQRADVPVVKSIWQLDDREIGGKKVSEWVRHFLVDLYLEQGLSLDRIRDFFDEIGLSPRRGRYWGTSSVRALLQPHCLLQYAGYGTWNVHDLRNMKRNGTKFRPVQEWEIEPNAHPAIITEEQADQIAAAFEARASLYNRRKGARSKGSRFLLSGGLFVCMECGKPMSGHRNNGYDYYLCGSARYNRGKGCLQPALWINKTAVEKLVLQEIDRRYGTPEKLEAYLREIVLRREEEASGHESEITEIGRLITEKEEAIAALTEAAEKAALKHRAIPEALLTRLSKQEEELASLREQFEEARNAEIPLCLTAEDYARHYRKFTAIMEKGTPEERREMIRTFVHRIEVHPREKRIRLLTYEEPSHFRVVAGAGFEPATFGL